MGPNPDFVFFLPYSTFQLDQMCPTYPCVTGLDGCMDEQRASYNDNDKTIIRMLTNHHWDDSEMVT